MAPLIVRLPNHLGDACMCIAALDLLAGAGRSLILAGRAWAAPLFAAYEWPVVTLPRTHRDRVIALRAAARGKDGLLFTNSFSTALDFRLAGIRATGYARGGRSLLLTHPVAVHRDDHMVAYYYRLAATLIERPAAVPADLSLRVAPTARTGAAEMLVNAGVRGEYIVLCPVAVGRHHGKLKAWDGFTQLNQHLLAQGRQVVALPGPGETRDVSRLLPGATVLPETDVGTFAALLAGSTLVVANDSGPGHLAAAVGAQLISVFGVTEPEKTRPWGSRVRLVGSASGWPRYEEVLAVVGAALVN